jgi:hypothetical protein
MTCMVSSRPKVTIFDLINLCLEVCDMVFKVNGIPEKYITLGVELPRGCDTCTGIQTVQGERDPCEVHHPRSGAATWL